MPTPSKPKKDRLSPTNRYAHRSGAARAAGIVLGIAVLGAAVFAGYAVWSLLQSPAQPTQAESDDGFADPSQGMAETESIEEILGAVQVYVREENFEAAQRVLEGAVATYPSDQELRLALGDLYLLTQQVGAAYEQYLAGIEIGPETWAAHFTAGTIANTLGQPEIAEVHYHSAMRLDPANPETPLYLAAIQIKLNKLTDAKASLAMASKADPDSPRAYAMRADIAMKENKPTIALEQVRKARAIEPNALGLVLLEAKALNRMQEPQEAVDLLTALPLEHAVSPDVVTVLAECLGMLGNFDDAASRMMDAAERHPDNADLQFETALWLQRAGRDREAVEWAQKAANGGSERAKQWLATLP